MERRSGRKPGCNQYTRRCQPCETCRRYAGGCSWTAVGEDGRVKFEPVSGWVAEKVPYRDAANQLTWTYQISSCPRSMPDGSRDRGGRK